MLGLRLRLRPCQIAGHHRQNHAEQCRACGAQRLNKLQSRGVPLRLDHAAPCWADAAGDVAVNGNRLVFPQEVETEAPASGKRKRMIDPGAYGAHVQNRDFHTRQTTAYRLIEVDTLDPATFYVWHLAASLEKSREGFNRVTLSPSLAGVLALR